MYQVSQVVDAKCAPDELWEDECKFPSASCPSVHLEQLNSVVKHSDILEVKSEPQDMIHNSDVVELFRMEAAYGSCESTASSETFSATCHNIHSCTQDTVSDKNGCTTMAAKLKLHKCADCKKTFETLKVLTTHMRIHTGERPYLCICCGKRFRQSAHLKSHLLCHTGAKPYSCTHCGKQFAQPSNLKTHEKLHNDPQKFRKFIMKPLLPQVNSGVTYPCKVCGKQFVEKSKLKRHQRYHTDTDSKAETVETVQAGTTSDVGVAETTDGLEQWKVFQCDDCQKIFKRMDCLKRHMRCHTGEKPFACIFCEKRCSQLVHLKEHLTCHTGVKPYTCTQCGKRFARSSNLRNHERLHEENHRQRRTLARTVPKLFHSCDECGKQFADRNKLRVHERSHSGEKPYLCMQCGNRFRQTQHLKRHLICHGNVKPYSCSICGKCYAESSSLKHHLLNHSDYSVALMKKSPSPFS